MENGLSGTPPSPGQLILKVLIPGYAAGAVIGKGGQIIVQLQKDSGAIIKLSKAKDFYPGWICLCVNLRCMFVVSVGSPSYLNKVVPRCWTRSDAFAAVSDTSIHIRYHNVALRLLRILTKKFQHKLYNSHCLLFEIHYLGKPFTNIATTLQVLGQTNSKAYRLTKTVLFPFAQKPYFEMFQNIWFWADQRKCTFIFFGIQDKIQAAPGRLQFRKGESSFVCRSLATVFDRRTNLCASTSVWRNASHAERKRCLRIWPDRATTAN